MILKMANLAFERDGRKKRRAPQILRYLAIPVHART